MEVTTIAALAGRLTCEGLFVPHPMASFISKLFGANPLSHYEELVEKIGAREQFLTASTAADLTAQSETLRKRIGESENIDVAMTEAIPEAFALVREAAKRTLKQRHFDVQLIGGMVLHEGKIAEMMTGEGKTLVATLPAYLNALSGRGVHVITVNDYLAKRDAIWMGQVYHALGLTVSCIVHDSAFRYDPTFDNAELDTERDRVGSFKILEKFLRPITRQEAYRADITYGTNHEFGFDYLRDNLVLQLQQRVQRGHPYAIIDEVDSILIDEARTPLIIAAPDQQSSEYYRTFARIVTQLQESTDYEVDEKHRSSTITDAGIEKVEKLLGIENLFAPDNARLVHYLEESLKAKAVFKRDKDYVVKENEVIIVDEFTGRMLHGRRYSGGLHQAIEAKEGVLVKEENRTFAQVTIQNYFRLYKKLAGMTGTAQTSAEEFHKVYSLDVTSVPSNRPLRRKDLEDWVYKTKDAKYAAVAKEVRARHEKGQPVLLGTTSITQNEIISSHLYKAGIPHEVLNEKNHEREGEIIAQAGKVGAVTVATNMAGRGVDIVLGGNPPNSEMAEKVRELGGLHVIGTERHDARRIDNQLRGRAGRQGDPGSSQFFLSLEDDLLRIFGGDRIGKIMQMVNFPEEVPIESGMVSKSVNQAQTRVEGANFDIRKHLLDFDDVLNKQRTALYAKRTGYLEAGEKGTILEDVRVILEHFAGNMRAELETDESDERAGKLKLLEEKMEKIPAEISADHATAAGQHLVRILDALWVENLEHLEGLRDTVNIRAYGQHEPLVEYRKEAHMLYQKLTAQFESLVFNTIFQLFELKPEELRPTTKAGPHKIEESPEKHVGRNDPCWCGSGKKFKKCHGK